MVAKPAQNWRAEKAALFTLVAGPPIGGASAFLAYLMWNVIQHTPTTAGLTCQSPACVQHIPFLPLYVVLGSYAIGAVPAVIAACTVWMFVEHNRGLTYVQVLAAGLAGLLLFRLPWFPSLHLGDNLLFFKFELFAAVSSALICRWLMARFGWFDEQDTPPP
jgi:hypothetical protein